MKQFEHVWDSLPHPYSILSHVELLNKRSEEGYELVTVICIDDPNRRLQFYWKRPVYTKTPDVIIPRVPPEDRMTIW